GSRKGVATEGVLAAIDAALASHGLTRSRLDRLATAPLKAGEEALHNAADELGLALIVVDDAVLAEASDRTMARSEASLERAGTRSVSEASALAAAGSGSRLLGPRVVVGAVTCAIAISGESVLP